MINLSKPSPVSGETNTMSFDMDRNVFDECFIAWSNGELIQKAFPMLNADQREFLMTGMTVADWNKATETVTWLAVTPDATEAVKAWDDEAVKAWDFEELCEDYDSYYKVTEEKN